MTSQDLAVKLADLALSKKASDIKILDLRGVTTVTDFFVICSGDSDTHIKAISDAVIQGAKDLDERAWHKEGIQNLRWVLLDYVDVVVHIFQKDTRIFYGLEKLWGDAKIIEVEDKVEK